MKRNSPIRGLLTFSLYASLGNASLALLGCIVLAIVFLITDNILFLSFLKMCGFLIMPMYVILSLGDKEGRWERFQLTMPIKRSSLLKAQYLSVVLSLIAPAIIVAITFGVRAFLQMEALEDDDVMHVLALAALGMPFFMAGIFFPLSSSKLGRGKEAPLLTICQFAALAILLIAPWASEQFGLPLAIVSVSTIAVSLVIFIASFFVTSAIYSKMDF
ncbi:MAG: ABC-2 transporter permease [Oscillospiraceae bacterium]|nr:ABC-2 transporter permease [Oscillospiraceae bacterium]